MNISNLNFNLLKALNALLTEQNVSRAGIKLGITQSAMSIALKQLREIYQDDLLVRGQRGQMSMTTFGKSLIPAVRQALQSIETAFITPVSFNQKVTSRIFHIGMSDYLALVLMPKLMQFVTQSAPNIKIVQHAINYLDSTKPFEETTLDIAIGQFSEAPPNLKVTSLFTDNGVIAADKSHPLFKKNKITLKEYARYPQVFVSLENRPDQNGLIGFIETQGCRLNVALMTPHTVIALQALPRTLLISNVVEHLANPFVKMLGLAIHQPPYDVPKYHAQMYWHARDQNDPGHQWLREIIKKISKMV